jgi:hypothetical protein
LALLRPNGLAVTAARKANPAKWIAFCHLPGLVEPDVRRDVPQREAHREADDGQPERVAARWQFGKPEGAVINGVQWVVSARRDSS